MYVYIVSCVWISAGGSQQGGIFSNSTLLVCYGLNQKKKRKEKPDDIFDLTGIKEKLFVWKPNDWFSFVETQAGTIMGLGEINHDIIFASMSLH